MKKLVFPLLLVCQSLLAQTPLTPTDYIGSTTPPGHPRILLLKGEEDAIVKAVGGDKVWVKMQHVIVEESDRINGLPPVEHV